MMVRIAPVDDRVWTVTGPLDSYSIDGGFQDVDTMFQSGPGKVLDLSGVERFDSAGLAFLVELQRRARRAGVRLNYKNIPRRMRTVASVYGLDEILPEEAFGPGGE
ncbi:MAG: STAS domain-containing protein [Gammaproteobacteria bacterium]